MVFCNFCVFPFGQPQTGTGSPNMKICLTQSLVVSGAFLIGLGLPAAARADELEELKATMQSMQKTMEQMQQKIAHLEQENHRQKERQAESAHTAKVAPASSTLPVPAEGPSA